MAKVTFASLKLKTNDKVKVIKVEDKEIEVKQYLPANEKYDLIMISLQQALEDNIINDFKLEIAFNLNLVFLYTNISFTDKQKEDLLKLYDILESNGVIDAVASAIPEEEYNFVVDMLDTIKETSMKYNTSIAGAINGLIENLPKNAQTAANIVDNFDPEKYENVVDFARGIGMKI